MDQLLIAIILLLWIACSSLITQPMIMWLLLD